MTRKPPKKLAVNYYSLFITPRQRQKEQPFAIQRSDLMETAATASGNSRPLVFAWLSHDSFTMKKCVVVVLFAILVGVISTETDSKEEEKRARDFLEKLNERTAKRNNRVALAKWAYATNITDANLQEQVS